MADSTVVTDEEILGHFESLGDNCEFGLVQRAVGVEQLGFFRFNYATMPALVRALDSDFAEVDQPDRIEIETDPNQELMVLIRGYRFRYHTFTQLGDADVAALHAQQVKVIRFLARKLLEDLRAAEKIFVRKGPDCATDEQAAALLRVLRRHGPVTLLQVVPQDEAHPTGRVEVIAPGLLKGYIDRFATFENVFDFSLAWTDICRAAHRLWRDNSPPGTAVASPAKRAAGNLIRQANTFGGTAWRHPPHATARLSRAVPRQDAACGVMEHTLTKATDGGSASVYGYSLGDGVVGGSVYVASLWIWLPADFPGTLAGAVFDGVASVHIANARPSVRGGWQRVWVSARVPPGATGAHPSLYVVGPAGTRLFSSGWKLELGYQPTVYEPVEPRLPVPQLQPAMQRPGRRYRPATLHDLAAEPAPSDGPRPVECIASLPPTSFVVPAVAFGDTGPVPAGRTPMPAEAPGALTMQRGVTPIFLLRDVLLHGQHGVVTQGERVVAESLEHFPFNLVGGAAREEDGAMRLPELPLSATVHSACHLLLCNHDNYFHWMIDALTRFRPAQYEAFAAHPDTTGGPLVLVPTLDVFWKWETLGALMPNSVPRMALTPQGRVFVQRLLYVPDLSGGCFNAHPAVLEAFDTMRARVFGGSLPRPWRRIYVSRSDSHNRVLANEAEVAERAERAGFTTVTLSRMSVWEQVRLFAEASHILAPHGAGLVNIGFCQPGAVLCELQMDRYVHWAFRCLAALRGVRYGRLIGGAIEPPDVPVRRTSWRLDLAALDAVLADPRFSGG